jgi:hypothetical protein
MIIAYTSYDNLTRVLAMAMLRWTHEDSDQVRIHQILHPPQHSGGRRIHEALLDNAHPLIFFGHGHETLHGPVGHDKSLIFEQNNSDVLANRLIVGICCHSCSKKMEELALQHGATILGFDGNLYVPYTYPAYEWFQSCILTALRYLLEVRAPASVALMQLKTEFRNKAQDLLKFGNADREATGFVGNAKQARLIGNENWRLIPTDGA